MKNSKRNSKTKNNSQTNEKKSKNYVEVSSSFDCRRFGCRRLNNVIVVPDTSFVVANKNIWG